MDRFSALRTNLSKECVIIFASLNLSIERKISYALICDIIQHIPSLFKSIEWCFDIDMKDTTAITEIIKHRRNANALLHSSLNTKGDKLVAIQRQIGHSIIRIEE